MNYRRDLESYRGIAILLIYFYHCKYINISGGYLGVDYFIILSGYLAIYKHIDIKEYHLFYSIKFIFIKLLRLVPSSNVVLIIMCYNYNKIYFNHPIILLNDIKSSFLFYSNYHFYFHNSNYFYAGENSSILLHYWYLSLEVQFCYIISLSVIIPPTYRYPILMLTFFISLIYNVHISKTNSSLCYLSILSRIWQFLIFLFHINTRSNIQFYLSLVFIFTLFFLYSSNLNYPGIYGVLPTLLYYIIINRYTNNESIYIKTLEIIGNISYSFYLVHYILIKSFTTDFYSEIYILLFTLIISYTWNYNFDIYFKKPNKTNIFIFLLIIVFSIYCLSHIEENVKNLRYGLIYSRSIHPRLFVGLSPLLNLIEKQNCRNIYSRNSNYILLIGDSHMSQWLPFFIHMSDVIHSLILFKWTHRNKVINLNINYFNLIHEKINSTTINYLIISFFLTQLNIHTVENNIIRLIYSLKTITNNIYLVEDNPSHNRNPAYCLRNKNNKYCYGVLNYNASYYNYKKISNLLKYRYLSFSKFYIIKNIVPYIYKDILIYVDDNHLSMDFVISLIPIISKHLKLSNDIKTYNNCKVYYI